MAVIESTVLIGRSQEDIFDFLSDLRNEMKWNPGVESMEKLTDGPVGLGTKYLAKWKQSKKIEVVCTAFDRPDTWAYHNGGPVEVIFSASLSQEDGATRLRATFDDRPHGFFRVVFPFFMMAMGRKEKANMENLKTVLEGEADETS